MVVIFNLRIYYPVALYSFAHIVDVTFCGDQMHGETVGSSSKKSSSGIGVESVFVQVAFFDGPRCGAYRAFVILSIVVSKKYNQ
jgi:hypothetical protein